MVSCPTKGQSIFMTSEILVDRQRIDDLLFMREAVDEARSALALGEIPVGAVLVKGGVIIGRGGNRRLIDSMPFAHAEMAALAEGGAALSSWRFDGCTLYVTLEPCPMCAGAIVQTRVSRLVFGAYDPRAGACGSLYNITRDPRMTHRCTVIGGLLADECSEILRDFFRAKRRQRKSVLSH